MIDDLMFAALRTIAPNDDGTSRVFPDIAPHGTPRPYITYQSVGGRPTATLDGPDELRNSRMQINVWADVRSTADGTMEQVVTALSAGELNATPLGDPVSAYEEETKLRGSRLDFSIWYRP